MGLFQSMQETGIILQVAKSFSLFLLTHYYKKIKNFKVELCVQKVSKIQSLGVYEVSFSSIAGF